MARFIRHGGWCHQCSRSCNTANGAFEQGLSAYACSAIDQGRWRAFGAAWKKNGANVRQSLTPWFLVEGVALGSVGNDLEPILTDPQLVCGLTRGGDDTFTEGLPTLHRHDHPAPNGVCECLGGRAYLRALQEEALSGEDDDHSFDDEDDLDGD